jgi:hypothetical protein
MENLTEKELLQTSGGALPGTGFGILLRAGAGSLLDITFNSAYGDRQNTTTLSIGKDIDLGLGLFSPKQ